MCWWDCLKVELTLSGFLQEVLVMKGITERTEMGTLVNLWKSKCSILGVLDLRYRSRDSRAATGTQEASYPPKRVIVIMERSFKTKLIAGFI